MRPAERFSFLDSQKSSKRAVCTPSALGGGVLPAASLPHNSMGASCSSGEETTPVVDAAETEAEETKAKWLGKVSEDERR